MKFLFLELGSAGPRKTRPGTEKGGVEYEEKVRGSHKVGVTKKKSKSLYGLREGDVPEWVQ